jgi:hypothetical protein
MNSKLIKAVLASTAFAALGFASTGAQAATASATANATILEVVSLTVGTPLNFGTIAPDASSTGLVTISTAGGITCPLPLRCFGGEAAGAFTVRGSSGRVATITVPVGSATITNGSVNMTVDNFVSSAALVNLTGGNDPFTVGARLSVGAAQQAGVYTGNYNVSADYQ